MKLGILALLLFSFVAYAADSEPHQKTKLCGYDEANCMQVTSGKGGHVNLRDATGVELGTPTNPLHVTSYTEVSDFVARKSSVIASNAISFSTYTMTEDIGLTSFTFGGRGPGQGSVWRVDTTATQQIPGGAFNSSANVALWTFTGLAALTAPSPDYSTDQAHEGTGSLRWIFTQSDNNHYPAMTYTYSPAIDGSAWRYISAWFYNTVSAGGGYTRTISVILTDMNGATRTYSVAGSSTAAPFNASGWINILGELEAPTSETGTFDIYDIVSVTLKMADSGNKAGTVYWDDVEFAYQLTIIERIYIEANRTTQLLLNPSEVFAPGEIIGIRYKNNDTVSREFTVTARGISR